MIDVNETNEHKNLPVFAHLETQHPFVAMINNEKILKTSQTQT